MCIRDSGYPSPVAAGPAPGRASVHRAGSPRVRAGVGPPDWEVTKGHGEPLKEMGGGVETGGMALRPFAKHQKRKADDAETPSAADEFAQFFSNDPRPDEPVALSLIHI